MREAHWQPKTKIERDRKKGNYIRAALQRKQQELFIRKKQHKQLSRSRSAIEAHRTRLASWKRSMPPLSPQIANLRGPRTLESYGKADRSTEGR